MTLQATRAMFTEQQWYYSAAQLCRGVKAVISRKPVPALRESWHEKPDSVDGFVGIAGDAGNIPGYPWMSVVPPSGMGIVLLK
jgi:hypothetical protein